MLVFLKCVLCQKRNKFYQTMFRYTVVTIVVLTSSVIQPAKIQQNQDNLTCLFNTRDDLSRTNDPLLLIESSTGISIAYPISDNKEGVIYVRTDERLLVTCPSKRNKQNAVVINNQEIAVGICSTQTKKLEVEGQHATRTDLKCEYSITPELILTNLQCGKGVGTLLQIGYYVDSKWYKLIDICHNIADADTYYATHQLYGSGLEGAILSSKRKPFMTGSSELYKNISVDSDYKQENQKRLLTKLLGDSYFYEKNFCSRGHLCPDADQIFIHEQMATYFYANTAPQWQTINGGNWVTTEKNVRKLAIQLNTTLTITTGTYEVLELPDIYGTYKKVYFEMYTSQLRIPGTIWKLVVNQDDNSCIVFLSVNNPFIESTPQTICPDITQASGWPQLQDNFTKGFIYACDYKNFKKAVYYVPDFTCLSVLKSPFPADSNKRRQKNKT